MMIWEAQPDDHYWDDDGFGGDNSLEVRLYTYVDYNGGFNLDSGKGKCIVKNGLDESGTFFKCSL